MSRRVISSAQQALQSAAIPVVTSSNDTGAGGTAAAPQTPTATQVDRIYNIAVEAAVSNNGVVTPGIFLLPQVASQFFVIEASATVYVRTSNGLFNPYGSGQKLKLTNNFSFLEIENLNSFPVAVSIFVGTNDFESWQFSQTQTPFETYATSPTAQTHQRILIPDLSGQTFTAADGSAQVAIQRSKIIISNLDLSQGLFLQGGLTAISQPGGVLYIAAGQTLEHNSGGNFCLTINDLTVVNAIVSEIYEVLQ